jgi:hypothetical protein
MPFDGTQFQASQTTAGSAKGSSGTFGRAWLAPKSAVIALLRGTPAEPETTIGVAALLASARELITPPDNWVRGHYQRYNRFCAVGALRYAGRGASRPVNARAHDLLLQVARQRGFATVERMNDTSPHEAVLSAFDEAIAAAEASAE